MKRFSLQFGITAVALLLVLQACGGESGADGADGVTVTDSAGVRIVENRGDGAWADGEAWVVEEIFRVGGIDADPDAQFGAVVSVDVDDEGRVFVADNQARQVSVFSPEGELVSRIGQAGDGPGELGAMFLGMVVRDGEVWTIDPGAQGIQRFDADGAFLGATPFNIMGGIPVRIDETRDAVVAQRRAIGLDAAMGETGDAVTVVGGATTDTMMVLPPGETLRIVNGEPKVVLFAPEPFWDVAADGSSVRGMMQRYRLEIRDPAGRLVRIVERDVAADPMRDPIRDMILDRLRAQVEQQVEGMGAPPEAMGAALQQMEQMEFADSLPLIAQAILETDGHLWVQRTTDFSQVEDDQPLDMEDLGTPRWDVFAPDGTYLGQVELPGRFQPLRLVDGVMWGVDVDDLEVQSVVGMRVVR